MLVSHKVRRTSTIALRFRTNPFCFRKLLDMAAGAMKTLEQWKHGESITDIRPVGAVLQAQIRSE